MSEKIEVQRPVALTFLDDFNMTSEPVWGPLTPGQLSGLFFDAKDTYVAISDDRRDRDQPDWSRGYARFYKIKLPIEKKKENPREFTITFSRQFHFTYLNDVDGRHMPFEKLDGEGIALLPNGNLVISSEGNAQLGGKANGQELPVANPAVYEFTRRGRLVRSYPIPEYYHPVFDDKKAPTQGIVQNNGFESLTRFGDSLYTATEGPLVQDGGAATFQKGGFARILKFSRQGNTYQPSLEFAYPVDPVPLPKSWGGPGMAEGGENGVVEMIALDENTLLVLERAFVKKPYFRNHIRLYRVNLSNAANTLGHEKLDKDRILPASKELVLDFEAILDRLEPNQLKKTDNGALENYEGMALVKLPDGSQGIVFIADNNHKVEHQRQSILLFRIEGI